MLKLAGACLIMVSTAGIGVSFGSDLKRRSQELRILKQLIYMLRGEIKYTKTPLPEAFYHISVRLPRPFGPFLAGVAEVAAPGGTREEDGGQKKNGHKGEFTAIDPSPFDNHRNGEVEFAGHQEKRREGEPQEQLPEEDTCKEKPQPSPPARCRGGVQEFAHKPETEHGSPGNLQPSQPRQETVQQEQVETGHSACHAQQHRDCRRHGECRKMIFEKGHKIFYFYRAQK